jgi:signal transduction histidine kinase/DNA-binding response OmpR family regulator
VTHSGAWSERAIILAPSGRDAEIASVILRQAGYRSHVAPSLEDVACEIDRGAGMLIVADEAIAHADLRSLARTLEQQPAWSDLPIVLMTRHGGGPDRNPVAGRLAELLGNVTFLERPFHPTTLASLVRTAIRSRRRQYDARVRIDDLGESEQRLQTALRAGKFGSWSLDLENFFLTTSEACRSHFGRVPEQPFAYEELIHAVHRDDRDRMQRSLLEAIGSASDYVLEFRNVWPDRSVHWIDMRGRCVLGLDGKPISLVGVSADITARRTAEAERESLLSDLAAERVALSNLTLTLEQRVEARTHELMLEVAAREQAQDQLRQAQKMESIGQLTGGVAHDFNNLLMAVLGNLQLLRKRLPDDPRTRRLIDGAMQGAERGASLTQRLLAFSRQQELQVTSIDLAALLFGMEDLLERSLGPQTALEITLAPGLPPALGDINQLELAILNLAINARDAMPEGGVITITVDRPEDQDGDVAHLRIRMTDTGIGMDGETLAKAIEPFFSTKPVGKGTGLGLSMVHGLTVQLGGRLELDSAVGAGTTVTLWLPVATPEHDAPSTHLLPPGLVNSGRIVTILVVDDDPLIAGSTVDMLEDLGHTVIEVNSGRRALEVLEDGLAIDLMMTDHAMPGMTGTQLATFAKALRPGLPILLATGYAELSSGEAEDLPRLPKPYRQEQLQAEIEKLLER